MWWLLSREVLRLRGAISREVPWDIMPDLYFYRDPQEVSPILKNMKVIKQFFQVKNAFGKSYLSGSIQLEVL